MTRPRDAAQIEHKKESLLAHLAQEEGAAGDSAASARAALEAQLRNVRDCLDQVLPRAGHTRSVPDTLAMVYARHTRSVPGTLETCQTHSQRAGRADAPPLRAACGGRGRDGARFGVQVEQTLMIEEAQASDLTPSPESGGSAPVLRAAHNPLPTHPPPPFQNILDNFFIDIK